MKIAVVASEAAPFVKTGGLGDVMQALPLALSQQKNTYVSLFIPYYSQIKYSGKWQTEFLGAFDVPLAWRREYVGIFRLKTRRKKLQIYFIDNEHYFNRGGVYGFADDGERYAYFSKAVLAAMNYLELQPDVVSCHDWQAALIPLLLKTEYRGCFPDAKSVFTIHNIEYQGKCNLQFNYDVLGLGAGCDEILRFDDCTNFMKSAIVTADRVTTVSETYAQELRYPYYSHGLDGVARTATSRSSGRPTRCWRASLFAIFPSRSVFAVKFCAMFSIFAGSKTCISMPLVIPEKSEPLLCRTPSSPWE